MNFSGKLIKVEPVLTGFENLSGLKIARIRFKYSTLTGLFLLRISFAPSFAGGHEQ